ncbi:MAG: radical SAM protein [Spirochaetales bacterium]|nr:radical SAM protein [Spirochaetales bacterium]
MKIQTLSIVVPAGCPNRCSFCVSRLHNTDKYINQIEKNTRFKHLYRRDYLARLGFARDNGCNTIVFTGSGEPILNMEFLESAATWNRELEHPFRWLELQTSGTTLNEKKLKILRNEIKVATIALSLSSIWSDDENAEYNNTPAKLKVNIESLCRKIRELDFNLRLSLNLTDKYNRRSPEEIFDRASALNANQITFRILYKDKSPETELSRKINLWIENHSCEITTIDAIKEYIITYGRKLEQLPFGAIRYSVQNISTVVDEDCMSMKAREVLRYLILRPDCKLYTKWDDQGSLLF